VKMISPRQYRNIAPIQAIGIMYKTLFDVVELIASSDGVTGDENLIVSTLSAVDHVEEHKNDSHVVKANG
jgi:hypothetical protein